MSIDEQAEKELHAALRKVWALPWKKQRDAIIINTVTALMRGMGWRAIELSEKDDELRIN